MDGASVFGRPPRAGRRRGGRGTELPDGAKLFGVSVSSVVKWSQRYRQSGSAAAKPMGGVRRAVLADHRAWLLERIKQKPDLTLQAIRSELAARGVIVSLWAVWKFYASEKMTFKKKPAAI
jgi:transposase